MSAKKLGAAALGALVGLMASTAAFAATELTFYHYQTGKSYDVFRGILNEFEAANPDVKVKDVFAQSEQITAEVQAALAAGRPVVVANPRQARRFTGTAARRPAAPVGVAPVGRDSGTTAGTRRSAGGRAGVRSARCLGCLAAVRPSPTEASDDRLRAPPERPSRWPR